MALVAACSSESERSAPALPAATQSNNHSSGAAMAVSPSQADLDLRRTKEGYHLSSFHGQRLYCRTESITGTRFTSQVCLTEAQIQAREQNARDTLNRVIPDSTCLRSSACN
jgi:hypothetical protein